VHGPESTRSSAGHTHPKTGRILGNQYANHCIAGSGVAKFLIRRSSRHREVNADENVVRRQLGLKEIVKKVVGGNLAILEY
jgi:hypothetical protein